MYHISIGEYKVNDGETLPTKNLGKDYDILWDTEYGRLYTLILIDEGFEDEAISKSNSYVNLFLANVDDIGSTVIEDYKPLSEDPKTRVYSLYLFEQSCEFDSDLYHNYYDRTNFNLEEMLDFEQQKGCPLYLIDKVTFYGVSDPYAKPPNIFNEIYDTTKFNDEDYRILSESVYGISNTQEMSIPEIVEKINKILLYKKTP